MIPTNTSKKPLAPVGPTLTLASDAASHAAEPPKGPGGFTVHPTPRFAPGTGSVSMWGTWTNPLGSVGDTTTRSLGLGPLSVTLLEWLLSSVLKGPPTYGLKNANRRASGAPVKLLAVIS